MSEQDGMNWKFVGGNLCLDFINSVGGRITSDENNPIKYEILKDKFESYIDLVEWGKDAGVFNKISANNLKVFHSENERAGNKIFERAIVLRESFYKIFKNITLNTPPLKEDLNLLNKECAAAREEQKLFYNSNKFTWDFEPKILYPESIIWRVSLSAADLLVSNQLSRVKQCPGDNCGWLFLDTSKNGSRQWCDMKDCGNLAKVRRFREKQK